jgi:WD40 repeat protein
MTSLDYQVLSRRIYSNFPVLGWLLRRWAAWQLAKDDGSGEAVAILAEVVTRSRDRAVREMALAVLNRLRTQDAINGFCRVWVETRHEDLTEILRSRRYVATERRLRVLSALKVGALDVVKRGGVEVLDFLLAALNDRDTQVATVAASCVSALENRVVIDELCRRWVESRSSQLEGIIRQGVYVASQPVAVRVLTALKFNQVQKIRDGGIEVLDCVLKALDDRDMEVVRSANVCAVSLTNRGAIDELCKRWASSRNKQLEQIIQKGKYITSQSVETQFLVKLKFYPSQKTKVDSTEVLDSLIAALSDRDNEIVKSASISITQIKDKNIIDVLCKKWIDNPTDSLKYIIRQSGYEPYEASTKALFYFLIGDWQKYEDLDFDQSLLSKAYYGASDSIQKLVADKAKMAGRIEWIKILTNTKKGFDVEKMTDNEWSNFTDILVAHLDRKEIWRFLYHAPVIWSKKLLDKFTISSCECFNQDEKVIIDDLLNLALTFQLEDITANLQYSKYKTLSANLDDFDNNSPSFSVDSLAISPDGSILASGVSEVSKNYSRKSYILIWSLPDGECLRTISGHTDDVHSLAITPDGQMLISGSRDKTIRLWSLPDGNHIKTFDSDHITCLAISPNGKILASGSNCYNIHLWSLLNREYIKTLSCASHYEGPNMDIYNYGYFDSLAISPDGRTLVSASRYSYQFTPVCFWDLPDGNFLCRSQEKKKKEKTTSIIISDDRYYEDNNGVKSLYKNREVESIVISPNSLILASIGYEQINLWNLNGEYIKTIPNRDGEGDRYFHNLVISHDGRTLISTSSEKIHLWSFPDGKHLSTIRHTGHHYSRSDCLTSLVISSNSQILVSSDSDGYICLWKSPNMPISKLTNKDIRRIELNANDLNLEIGTRNAFKFTLALLRLKQRFDIDIEDVSSDIQFSEFDIEIDG